MKFVNICWHKDRLFDRSCRSTTSLTTLMSFTRFNSSFTIFYFFSALCGLHRNCPLASIEHDNRKMMVENTCNLLEWQQKIQQSSAFSVFSFEIFPLSWIFPIALQKCTSSPSTICNRVEIRSRPSQYKQTESIEHSMALWHRWMIQASSSCQGHHNAELLYFSCRLAPSQIITHFIIRVCGVDIWQFVLDFSLALCSFLFRFSSSALLSSRLLNVVSLVFSAYLRITRAITVTN